MRLWERARTITRSTGWPVTCMQTGDLLGGHVARHVIPGCGGPEVGGGKGQAQPNQSGQPWMTTTDRAGEAAPIRPV